MEENIKARQVISDDVNLVNFVGNEGSSVNVEEVLKETTKRLEKAQKNINWLALYGGGGSGSGGGGTGPSVATGTIKVNSQVTGARIVRTDDDVLSFMIEQDITQSWEYTIKFNGKVIKSGTISKSSIVIADSSTKLQWPSNGIGSMEITASCGLSNIYWVGTIVKNSTSITGSDMNVKIDDINSAIISYKVSATEVGRYNLYLNNILRYTIEISEPGVEYNITIPLIDIFNNTNVGSNILDARFVSDTNPNISASCTNTIVITSNDIVISTNLSNVANSPTSVIKGANLLIKVTSYLQSEEFISQMIINLDQTEIYRNQDDLLFGREYTISVPTIGDEYVIGRTYTITISVSSHQGKSMTGIYYIRLEESNVVVLSTPKVSNLLCDFQAYGSSPSSSDLTSTNSEYVYSGAVASGSTATLKMSHKNAYAGIKAGNKLSDPTFYRLSNKAFGTISGFNIGGSLKTFQDVFSAKRAFTISLVYKADFHSDDDHTIFQLGTLDAENELNNGIRISVHKILVRDNTYVMEYPLQDSEIFHIDVTYDGTKTKIYVNGTITKASTKISGFNFGSSQLIFASSGNGLHYADCQFYRFLAYSTALSDFDLVINQLQSKSLTKFTPEGLPDDDVIINGVKSNFIEVDSEGNITKSWLWDIDTNEYSLSNFVTSSYNPETKKTTCSLNDNIKNFTIPIPVMFIDISTSSDWTWDNFIDIASTSFGEAWVQCQFHYYDQSSGQIKTGTCWIKIQGTSTKSNAIKNVDITFTNPVTGSKSIFCPKATWVPEESYTMKADIVDSSHSLNAACGKFINDALANSESEDRWFPLHADTLSRFKNSAYYKNCVTKPTMKVAVEGFPIFFIARFYDPDPTKVVVKSLGIYQFILGRNSVHNLGLKVLESVKDKNGDILIPDSFPYYEEGVTFEEADMESYWIEATKTFNVSNTVDFSGDLTKSDGLQALCWQPTEGVINAQFEVKSDSPIKTPYAAPHFKELMESIAKLPCVLYNYYDTSAQANSQKVLIGTSYPELTTNDGTTYVPTGRSIQVSNSDDEISNILTYLDLDTCYKQITTALLFGLLDNFCKNDPFILFDSKNNSTYRKGFYDMDSGAGGDNNSEISVAAYLYLKGLINDEGCNIRETFKSTDTSIISGVDNKLILSLEHGKVSKLTVAGESNNPFSYFWIQLRNYLYLKYSGKYDNLTEYFMNEYFIPQTEGCGELLFNLTYTMKYLNTAQSEYLSGRRIQQVTQWLSEHIEFLDSVASWKMTNNQYVPATISNNSIMRYYSYDEYVNLPITMNKSLVVNTTDQGGSYNYFGFVKKNRSTPVRIGSGTATANPIQKQISWCKNLIKLGDENQSFGNSGFARMDNAALYGFSDLDLANCSTLSSIVGSSPINFEASFIDSDTGISEMRVINLSNARNSEGNNNIVLDLAKFTKVTDIDISGACVGSIALPKCPLMSLNVTNSLITSFDLENQGLLKSIDISGCIKITDFKVVGCPGVTQISGLSNITNLVNVAISGTSNTELRITRCNRLQSVEIASSKLTSLVIAECPNLTRLNISGCTSLRIIVVTECGKFNELILPNDRNILSSVEALNLYGTKVAKTTYGTSESDLLDLSPFTGLSEFNIGANSEVKYIRLPNIQDSPIRLTKTFNGCSKLTRVYGNVLVNVSSAFSGCSYFTIHGGSYSGKSVTRNGVYLMPYEIDGYNASYGVRFQSGSNVTNMTFGTPSALNSAFYGTSCDQFDVYYVMSNLGSATSLSDTFRGLRTKLFTRTSSVDNSPHRNLFIRAAQITSMNWTFYGSCGNNYKLLSPSTNSDKTEVTSDNGLFSPLINLSSITLHGMGNFIADRFLFRRKEGNYNISTLHGFNPRLIVNDVTAIQFIDTTSSSGLKSLISSNKSLYGNISGFFDNLPNLSGNPLYLFLGGTYYINYDKVFKFPNLVYGLTDSLVSDLASGTVILKNYFTNPGKLTKLLSSFRVTGSDSGYKANIRLDNNTFNECNSITHIGWSSVNSTSNSTFMGFNKLLDYVNGEFPYNIFANLTNLTQVTYLFSGCSMGSEGPVIELPGPLFVNNTKLSSVDGLFADFRSKYKLTGGGFSNCPNLNSVSYLFYNSPNSGFYLQGSIPPRLLYHGSVDKTVTIHGTDDEPLIDSYGNKDWSGVTMQHKTITYSEPRSNINWASYLFGRCNCEAYSVNSYEDYQIETNPDYFPWKYKSSNAAGNGTWVEAEKNLYTKTVKWFYDGVTAPPDPTNTEIGDDVHSDTTRKITSADGTSRDGTLNYCCPTDLLRYCKNTCLIAGLFANSGSSTQHSGGGSRPELDVLYYGITGRIPPRLLEPFKLAPNGIDLSYMFKNCTKLSAYENNGKEYKIPYNFFKYAPKSSKLIGTFSGMIFEYNNDFGIFSPLTQSLDIAYVFFKSFFRTTSSNRLVISGIFLGKHISNCTHAFSCVDTFGDPKGHLDEATSTCYITFNGNFTTSKVTSVKTQNGNQSYTDSHVFSGYNANTVQFTNKSLSTDTSKYNYATR